MKKLNKVTPTQLKTIEECALQVSSGTWIPNYSVEDIRQEAIIIGINGLRKYNGSIPLDKYLINHMRHRLRSLRKKMYIKPGCDCGNCLKCKNNSKRVRLNFPSNIDDVDIQLLGYTIDTEVESTDLYNFIDKKMPAEFREDYLKMLAGVSIISSRKNKIRSIVKEILEEYGS